MSALPRDTPIPQSSVAMKFRRALLLRCPRCGSRGILRHWFKMQDHCPGCGLALERGESSDFWIGAYVFNLVAGEVIAIGIPIVWVIATWPRSPWGKIETVGIV